MIVNWVKEQVEILKSYEGYSIGKVMIHEMAIYTDDNGEHIFEDSDFPFIQAQVIYLWLHGEDHEVIKIHAYQNDSEWGIYSTRLKDVSGLAIEEDRDSIYRTSLCREFPLGKIDLISPVLNSNGDISEVKLVIESREVFLKSGEVYENHDGTISIKSDDESVLVFLSRESFEGTSFNN